MKQEPLQKSFLYYLFMGATMVIFVPIFLALLIIGVAEYAPFLVGGRSSIELLEIVGGVFTLLLGGGVMVYLFGHALILTAQVIQHLLTYRPPDHCMLCQKSGKKFHGYHLNKLRTKNEYLFLCTDCLVDKILDDLNDAKSKVVFTEPVIEEGYGFSSFDTDKDIGVNLATHLPDSNVLCKECSEVATTAWVPSRALKATKYLEYKTKEEFGQSTQYCYQHVCEKLKSELVRKRRYFYEFWPIKEKVDGYFF